MKNTNLVISDNTYPRILLYRPSPRGWLCEIMLHASYSEVFGPFKHIENAVKEAIDRLDLGESQGELELEKKENEQ